MMKTIKISKRLAKRLRSFNEDDESILHLFGKNEKDIITNIFELPTNNEGCVFEQGIDGSEMSKTLLKVYKKNLIPGGFFYINTYHTFNEDIDVNMGDFAAGVVSKKTYMEEIVNRIFYRLESFSYNFLKVPVIVVCENNLYAKYNPNESCNWRNLKIVEV